MAQIAYILLCHKDPEMVIQQAELLTAAGDYIAIHFDSRANPDDFAQIQEALEKNSNVTFAKQRVKCGWGEWSLVQATLNAVEAALEAFIDATHFFMISGDCAPVKSAKFAHNYLDRENVDYIESFDFFESDWIMTGIKEERLIYHHWFNERTQPRLYYLSFNLQQRLGLKRTLPHNVQIRIGSQWWCLRRKTLETIFEFLKNRPDVIRFFRTTWIPDETFFQTMVYHLVPEEEIRTHTLTFLMFTDYGLPVVFHNDHYHMLLSQSQLFARKISPEAHDLRDRLAKLYMDTKREFLISDSGRHLFGFLTKQGRNGRRFTERFWEIESSIGWDRELLIVVCKKWHVAKRVIAGIRRSTLKTPALNYVFNELDAGLPHLGGIENSLTKRTRHRRSLMRMVYDYFSTDSLIICLDPTDFDTLQDFATDRATLRVLEIDCQFSDKYVRGHAERIGLANHWTPEPVLERLVPMVRKELYHERDVFRAGKFGVHLTVSETNTLDQNAEAIALFLDISIEEALKIAQTPDLFDD